MKPLVPICKFHELSGLFLLLPMGHAWFGSIRRTTMSPLRVFYRRKPASLPSASCITAVRRSYSSTFLGKCLLTLPGSALACREPGHRGHPIGDIQVL